MNFSKLSLHNVPSPRSFSRRVLLAAVGTIVVTYPTVAATPSSIGEAGVDARRLHGAPYNLTGKKIAIGQVEIGRPSYFGIDKAASRFENVRPAQIFFRNRPARPNTDVDRHATEVAAVMVSRLKGYEGVAPDARLYSSAVGSPRTAGQAEECLASQHIAQQNNHDVRAINFSFGEPLSRDPRLNAQLDGNALLTLCIDWLSRTENVLFMVAGNQGSGGIPIPTDQFNGLNIAYSNERNGIFSKIDFSNLSEAPIGVASRLPGREINLGDRRSISLAAPGSNISLYNLDGNVVPATGTSFATPHVTAAVALLQEFGDRQIFINRPPGSVSPTHPQWNLAARRHEVMKAVLMNSADKLKDNGDGLLQGMSRTLLTKNNRTWLNSDAHNSRQIPIDYQMGAGHLNAFRAYQQFSPGQHRPGTVPTVAWDYSGLKAGEFREYIIDRPLKAGSFLAATLAWDRVVDLTDKNRDGVYNIKEKFVDRGLNDLDIYLMRISDTNPNKSIWSSQSRVDSVEHMFFQIPTTERYKIRVYFKQKVNNLPQQFYGLAWWGVGN